MSEAVKLNTNGVVKNTCFSTRGLPLHFVGDRDAQTVFVMLNPGEDACVANCMFNAKTATYNRQCLSDFIDSYKKDKTKVTVSRSTIVDSFDLKQAAFLKPWCDNGISLPMHFPTCKCAHWDAVENVLNQKLQLELLPYSSNSIGTMNKKDMDYIMPFLETIFDEISSKERKYVIFGYGKFEMLFDYFNDYSARNNSINKVSFVRRGMKTTLKNRYAYCSIVTVHYYTKKFRAIIAPSFSNQAYSKSYLLMQQYGRFCYDEYVKLP